MKRFLALLIASFLMVVPVQGATVAADDALTLSEASSGNAYLAGASVRITAPIIGDAVAAAGDIIILAPVDGDTLLIGGGIEADGPVGGDLRAIGARVTVKGDAVGDIFIIGGSVRISGKSSDVRVGGVNVEVTGGADGPVVIYGSSVTLGGEFAGNVEVFASDKLTVLEGTRIVGVLEYDAPQEADIHESVVLEGGVEYTGSSSFLPSKEEAQTFAIAGAGLFLVVRMLALVVASGLVAGLFPAFTNQIASRVISRSARRFVMLALLGFAIAVATPILIFLLILSFVGAGIAFILGAAYVLLLLISYAYAGVLVGACLARLLKRSHVSWRAAVAGAALLGLIGLLPILGTFVVAMLTAAAGGAVVSACYRFAFGRDADEL